MFKNLLKAGKGTIAKKLMVIGGTMFGVALAATLMTPNEEPDEIAEDEELLDLSNIPEPDEETTEEDTVEE